MNTNRLLKVLKWNIIGTKKNTLRMAVRLTLAFLFIVIAFNLGNLFDRSFVYADIQRCSRAIVVASTFVMLLFASQICFNMKTKTEFTNYAMLPATKFEKFFANLLYHSLFRIVLVLVAVIVADAIQALIFLIVTHDCCSLTLLTLKSFAGMSVSNGLRFNGIESFENIILFLFVHSTFVFGGTFFRKNQFLYTALMWFLLPTLFTSAFVAAIAGIAYWLQTNDYVVTYEMLLSETQVVLLLDTVILLAAFGFYYLAFRYFRRMQIINNKFFN